MPASALLLGLVTSASAADCTAQLGKAESLAPGDVASAYAALIACDRKVAESNFLRFMVRATDTDALVDLYLKAIDADVWGPTWVALGKVPDYSARDEVAQRIGEVCAEHPKVVTFLQGAYSLRDVEFQQWDDGFGACADDKLWAWTENHVKNPPAKQFDEKYNSLVTIYVKRKRIDALPALAEGVVKAAGNDGPFDAMLAQVNEAAMPPLGGSTSAEDQQKVVTTLADVATKVDAQKARSVANALANAGAEGAAAKLLPVLFPERVQSGGSFLYGAATVEAGTCGGQKTAVLHYATVSEPGKRWSILGDLEAPMRALKPKLKDCEMESPWPVMHTPEPIKAASEGDAWAEAVVKEWAAKGYETKIQKEKGQTLP